MKLGRVVIKVSGESLAGDDDNPLSLPMFNAIADQLETINGAGTEIAVVIGAGNLFRGGRDSAQWGIPTSKGDRIGMYATGLNAMLLQALCEERGLSVTEVTRGPCTGFGQANWQSAQYRKALSRGEILIISGGLGEPGISTDSPAVQLAIDVDAQSVIMAKHGITAVHVADPKRFPDARPIHRISARDAIASGLQVVDQYALQLCRDSQTAIHIVGADDPSNLSRAAQGRELGSLILPDHNADLIAV